MEGKENQVPNFSSINGTLESNASTASCISFGPEDFLDGDVVINADAVPTPIAEMIKTEVKVEFEPTPGPSTSPNQDWSKLGKKTKKKESRKTKVRTEYSASIRCIAISNTHLVLQPVEKEKEDLGSADEEEEIGVADTFTEYKPAKCTFCVFSS